MLNSVGKFIVDIQRIIHINISGSLYDCEIFKNCFIFHFSTLVTTLTLKSERLPDKISLPQYVNKITPLLNFGDNMLYY